MSEPLTAALAEAASRRVGASKIGPRKGSVAAVARAMSERGIELSNNTLSRKLDGLYPMTTDEIAALAAVLGIEPDDIWQDALRIMRESAPAPQSTIEKIEAMMSPETLAVVEEEREKVRRKRAAEGVADPFATRTRGLRSA